MNKKYFTSEEMKKYKITDYIYSLTDTVPVTYNKERLSIWDLEENHKRWKKVLECKDNIAFWSPYIPLHITDFKKLGMRE